LLRDDRKLSIGGRVALYLKSNVNFMLRDDLKIDGIENLWVDTQDLLIGVLYNPPIRSKREFLDEFEQVLHSIFLSKQKCLILGDININTLVKSTIAKEYLNLVHSEGFKVLKVYKKILSNYFRMLLLECYSHIYTQ